MDVGSETDNLDKDFLQRRMEALGLNPHAIAVRIAQRREERTGEKQNTGSIRGSVAKCINAPHKTTGRILEEVINALDGELIARWRDTKLIAQETTHEEQLTGNQGEQD